MNTLELQSMLTSDPIIQSYSPKVLALDQFINIKKVKPALYVCNEQPSHMIGSHWFLIFDNTEQLYFIDSLGRDADYYGLEKELLKMNDSYTWIDGPLQSAVSEACGLFVIFFAFNLCRKMQIEDILTYFTHDVEYNEQCVRRFIQNTFML